MTDNNSAMPIILPPTRARTLARICGSRRLLAILLPRILKLIAVSFVVTRPVWMRTGTRSWSKADAGFGLQAKDRRGDLAGARNCGYAGCEHDGTVFDASRSVVKDRNGRRRVFQEFGVDRRVAAVARNRRKIARGK